MSLFDIHIKNQVTCGSYMTFLVSNISLSSAENTYMNRLNSKNSKIREGRGLNPTMGTDYGFHKIGLPGISIRKTFCRKTDGTNSSLVINWGGGRLWTSWE